jgi:hypothetical protein
MKKIHSNLIGLSGKLNSGKDYSAKIIQWLVAKGENIRGIGDLDGFCTSLDDYRFKASGYQTKAFANTIKEMVAALLGVPRARLEDREFKETVIPSYGKSPREMLQTLGTGWGREMISDNIWATALLQGYQPLVTSPSIFEGGDDLVISPNWLITDVRFPNEVKAIEDAGGIVIRVNRPVENRHPEMYGEFLLDEPFEVWEEWLVETGLYRKLYHQSEMALDTHEFTHEVAWREDETDLIVDLTHILQDEGILQD